MAGPARVPLRVWVNLPANQQLGYEPRYEPDWLGDRGDLIVRPADSEVTRLEDNFTLFVNICIDDFEVPSNIEEYLRAQDPNLIRRPDDAWIERRADDEPIVRPIDSEDAAIERRPDNLPVERQSCS